MRPHLALSILLVIVGCGRDALVRSDLVGEWTLDEVSRYRLPAEVRAIDPHLHLGADGRFVAASLPGGMVYLEGRPSPTVVSGAGTWEIQALGGHQKLLLKFREVDGIGAVETSTTLDSSGTTSAIRLFWWADDPDAGGRVDFLRR